MVRIAPIVVFGLAYFSACALTIATSRIGGGLALVWIATALLAAKLRVVPASQHRPYLLAAAIGSYTATGLFGLGWLAAVPMTFINLSEGWIAAKVLQQGERRRGGNSPNLIGGNFLLSALVAPLCTVIPGAVIATVTTDVAFWASARNWMVGHVLGYLVFGPAFAMCLRGNMSRWFAELSSFKRLPTLLCLVMVIVASGICFGQSSLPLLFLPTLALVLLTYYGGREGAAAGLVLLAAIGGVLSLNGLGPITLMHAAPASRLQFFQAYLALTSLTLLPISAALAAQTRLFGQLQLSEERYRLLSDNVTDIVLSMTPGGTIKFVSPSIRNFGPYTPEDVIGRHALDLVDAEFHGIVREAQARTLLAKGEPVQLEYVGITYEGERRWFETNQRALLDTTGAVTEVVGTVREISARKALENKLTITALTDALTGLPNRRALLDTVELTRGTGAESAIALLDLDHFKQLNDRHGHEVGDKALRHFAQVAQSCLRATDMVARWGGEEFAVLLPGANCAQAAAIVQRILDRLVATPLVHDQSQIALTVSAGVASLGNDLDLALSQADAALYRSKHDGRARLSIAA